MYRKPSKRQQDIRTRKLEAMRRGKDRARMDRPAPDYPPELPPLRRVVTVTDHDAGQAVTHTVELWRTRRVDTYAVKVDGKPWRKAGWSAVLAMLRKAFPRVPSARSSIWQDSMGQLFDPAADPGRP
jgi:hypothetical protein